jgi:hypothetical protein
MVDTNTPVTPPATPAPTAPPVVPAAPATVAPPPVVPLTTGDPVVQVTRTSSPLKYIIVAAIIIIAAVGAFAFKAYKSKSMQQDAPTAMKETTKTNIGGNVDNKDTTPATDDKGSMMMKPATNTSDTSITNDLDTIDKNLTTLDKDQQDLNAASTDKQDPFTDL